MTRKQREKLSFTVKLLLGIVFISPVLLGLLFSFVQNDALYGLPTLERIQRSMTIENYIWVFNYVPFLRFLLNSLIICGIVIIIQVFFASFAAYAFSFFKFPGNKLLFTGVQIAMMIPGEVVIISNYLQIQDWNLINTHIGLACTSLIGGTSIFMMRQFYLTIPRELKEAATIDGCGDMRFLFSIAMPLSVPSIASLAIYLFIGVYNQYFWPLLVTSKNEMRTIQIGVAMLMGTDALEYGHVLAGAILCLIPSVIIFIIGQDYLIKGMTSGAVKG